MPIVASIELTPDEALVAVARTGKGKPDLRRVLRIPLPQPPGDDKAVASRQRGEALKSGLKHAGLKIQSAVFVIPKDVVNVRYVVLPSTDDAELAQMARFEAERHIPFRSERHIVGHHVMRKEGLSGSHTLIAAADGPELDAVMDLASAAGVGVEAIDVASIAQLNVLPAATLKAADGNPVAILHLGARTVDISIFSKGVLLFTRSAPLGYERVAAELESATPGGVRLTREQLLKINLNNPRETLPPALSENVAKIAPDASVFQPQGAPAAAADPIRILNDWLHRLVSEISRSYDFAKREFECPPVERLFLSGVAARWPGLEDYLRTHVSADLKAVTPFEDFHIERPINLETRDYQAVYSGAIGALARYWRPGAVAVSLLPSVYVQQRAKRRQRQTALATVLLVIAAGGLGFYYLQQVSRLHKEELDMLRAAVEDLEPRVEALKEKEQQLNIIGDYSKDKRSALAILSTISELPYIPERVAITKFEFTKGNMVRIFGHALSLNDFNKFITDLENAKNGGATIFDDVIRRKMDMGHTLSRDRPTPLIDFHLECYMPLAAEPDGAEETE